MKLIHHFIFISILFFFNNELIGQSSFTIEVVPKKIEHLPPLHSYVHAQHDGKWLIIGGRTNHKDVEHSVQNFQIYVVDPVQNKVWNSSIYNLIDHINTPEHFAACYSSYFQDDNKLYIVGGYGMNYFEMGYQTFPYLTTIEVAEVMENIIEGNPVGQYFQQIENNMFAKNNGILTKIDHRFYLVGNSELKDISNESGKVKIEHNNVQEVISFSIIPQGKHIKINRIENFSFKEFIQTNGLSYVPQIFPDQSSGLTIFNNEKVEDVDKLSWMNLFDVGYAVYNTPEANIPHFHSTTLPIYNDSSNQMHSLFFGGCKDYWCMDEERYDSLVVEEMTIFKRDASSQTEVSQTPTTPFTMSGRDASFILNQNTPHYSNGIINYQAIKKDRSLIGWLYGGATTISPLIFDDGTFLDLASPQLFEIYLIKSESAQPLGSIHPNYKETLLSIHIPVIK